MAASPMAASLHHLHTRADRLRAEQAAALRQAVLDFPELPHRVANEIIGTIDRLTAADPDWTFRMVDTTRNIAVVEWLSAHSSRPLQAIRLWMHCFDNARHDTGEILIDRQQMADLLNIAPNSVSRIMGELVSIAALIRDRDGNRFRYFVNPRIATSLPGASRAKAQAAAPEPVVNGMPPRRPPQPPPNKPTAQRSLRLLSTPKRSEHA